MAPKPHRLIVPADVDGDVVDALAKTRFPHAKRTGAGLVLNRHARLEGPITTEAGLEYQLVVLKERGKPVSGRGLAAAFPDGMPIRAERRTLEWLVAVAEHTGGTVITADGVVVEPEPEVGFRLVVRAGIWLDPAAGRYLVRQVLPDAYTPVHTAPTPEVARGRRVARTELPAEVIAALTAAGMPTEPTAADLARTPVPPPPPQPRYSVVANQPNGIVTVEVDGTGSADSPAPVAYHVRWVGPPGVAVSAESKALILDLASRFADAASGDVVNAAGFDVTLPGSAGSSAAAVSAAS